MNNINPETGVRYGIISADSLLPEVFDDLCYGAQARDVLYHEAVEEIEGVIRGHLADYFDPSDLQDLVDMAVERYTDNLGPVDEPYYAGELDGVKYQTTWLGGAQMVWILHSPFIGRHALCSPCVPNCGDLDNDGDYECYDVPTHWRVDASTTLNHSDTL